jgi:hypothetical protein
MSVFRWGSPAEEFGLETIHAGSRAWQMFMQVGVDLRLQKPALVLQLEVVLRAEG